MKELQNFTNGIFNLDVKVEGEEVLFSAEQVAKSLGLTQKQNKSRKIYESIRWETINKYLPQLSGEIEKGSFIRVNEFLPQVAKVEKGSFISEPKVALKKLVRKVKHERITKF